MKALQYIRTIQEALEKLAIVLASIKTCSHCENPVVSRGLCATHYSAWRRESCKTHGVRRLRDIPVLIEPDPRQAVLFDGEVPF